MPSLYLSEYVEDELGDIVPGRGRVFVSATPKFSGDL